MSTNGAAYLSAVDVATKIEMVRAYLRVHAQQIRRIGDMGDKDAILFEAAYRAWWGSPLDPRLQLELIHVWEQFVVRDLTETERVILQNRFGYKVPIT